MARWLILAVVVIALSAIATLVANFMPVTNPTGSFKISAKEGPVAKVKVDGDPIFDFGTMSQKKTGTHSWSVSNEGKADLELWMLSSTCACTIAKFADKKRATVKPGESTKIDLEWETRETVGDFNKGATIGTNDPSQPSFPLNVKGLVHPPVVLIPNDALISMEIVSSDETKTANAALFAPDQPQLKILKVTTSNPDHLIVTPSPLSEAELKPLRVSGGYRLAVELKPGMPLGIFREEIVIQTDNKLTPEVKLLVSGTVAGPISVLPERLRLINVSSERGGSGEVTILVRGGRPTKFEVLRKPAKFEVEVAPIEASKIQGRYRVKVTIPPGTSPGQIEETIILKTDHPKAAEVSLPVSALVLGGSGG